MNALTRATSTALPRARAAVQTCAQRNMTTGSSGFKKNWLSDPGAYPVIGIVGFAMVGCSGFMMYKVATDKNVRVTGNTKGKVIRTW